MASNWVFGCQKGLAQDSCNAYQADPSARGYGQWNGCPSCKHRDPGNAETARAEAEARR